MAATRVGRGSDQFPLRLPDGLRDRIKRHAEANGRSMNSEIVHLIESGLFEADMSRMGIGLEPLREPRESDKELIAYGKKTMEAIEQRKQREVSGVQDPIFEPDDVPFFDEGAVPAGSAIAHGVASHEEKTISEAPLTVELFDQLFSKSKVAEEIEKLREELRATNAAIARADKLLGEK